MGGVPLLFIILLSMFGYAYSAWTDTVVITGTAEMGSLTIGITEFTLVEKYLDPETGVKKDGEWGGKDVGKVSYEWGTLVTDPHTGKSGYKNVIVKIENAYPCYQVHMIPAIKNIGTIPVHFVKITITAYDVTDNEELRFVWTKEYEKGEIWDNGPDNEWGTEDDVVIINVDVANFVCDQLEPCSKTKGEIDFHFKQEAEECHTYTFKITIEAVQWNKVEEVVGG